MVARKNQKIAVLLIATLVLIFLISLPVTAGSFSNWTSMTSGTANDFNSIWGTDDTDIFTVGNSGTILRYDGSAWSSMKSGTTADLYSVWGTGSNNVYAVGESGTIVHYNGSAWSFINSGTKNGLYGIWGTNNTDIFVVGSSGIILHYTGSTWNSMNSDNTKELYGVWGTDSNDVFAVGESGTIVHYDGSTWSSMNSGTKNGIACIWGTDGADIFAAGNSGIILHYDGSTWNSMNSGTTGDLYGIWGTGSNDVFAVGESGTIIHYNGSEFVSMNRNTNNKLRSVWGFSSMNVFTAGWSGTILRYLPPAINSISLNQGDQGETLNITITGTNLTGASEVRLGAGIAVSSFDVLSSTQIKANITIVAGAEIGARDTSVTTPGGSFTLPNSFTVKQSLPTITSVSPDQNRQGATLNVTITGTNLSRTSELRLGTGIAVNTFSVLSSNQITANITIAADAETGAKDISVTTQGGSFTLPNSFTVKQALPTITSISPDRGNQETTFNVTLDGTNLNRTSEIRLGAGIAVNTFSVLSSNQLSANISIASGAGIGTSDVSVTTPGGSFTLPNSFTVKQALPTITSISPDNGSQGATLNVSITGTNLTRASEVRLGTGIAVNSFNVLSSNRIEAVITIVTGTETGARDTSVTTPGGSFALPHSFTIKQGIPVITSISPGYGSQGETITVIISGSNLNGANSVSFGTGATVQRFTNLSPTQLSVNVIIDEKAVTGVRDVSVTTPGGSSTLGNSFNIKERSTTTLYLALLWVVIALVVVIFIIILNILRKKRSAKV